MDLFLSQSSHHRTKGEWDTAQRLHSALIRLQRRLETGSRSTSISSARLSLLSVLVFRGASSLSELATVEKVRPPTMTVLVRGLEADGLVTRRRNPNDRRAFTIEATARGVRALREAQHSRVHSLRALMRHLSEEEKATLDRTAHILRQMIS